MWLCWHQTIREGAMRQSLKVPSSCLMLQLLSSLWALATKTCRKIVRICTFRSGVVICHNMRQPCEASAREPLLRVTRAPCLLQDIPNSTFQAVLMHLPYEDHASLRQVSHSVCKRTNQHLPYIPLHLSEDSSSDQLQQWSQATQHLHDVTSVRMHISGKVSPDVFGLAMLLLSARHVQLTELRLLAASDNSLAHYGFSAADSPYLTSISAVRCLSSHLQILAIEGVVVGDMVRDLEQLASATAAVGGWPKLRSLSLHLLQSYSPVMNWAKFAAALQHLKAAFPFLQKLHIQVPPLEYSMVAASVSPAGLSGIAKPAKLAIVAALANTVLQLRQLEVVDLIQVPDPWVSTSSAASAYKENEEATEEISTHINAYLNPSIPAAVTSAFATLDDCGRWLLQLHPSLRQVHISTAGTAWSMTWQRHQTSTGSQSSLSSLFPSCSTAAMPVVSSIHRCLDTTTYDSASLPQRGGHVAAGALEQSISSSSRIHLFTGFIDHLPHYSTCPAGEVLQHIKSCTLKLMPQDVAGLDGLLMHLRSLKNLEVTVRHKRSSYGVKNLSSATAVISAAAAVRDLQCLVVKVVSSARVTASINLLLPLTTAAGGPGSSLKKLQLCGRFEADSTTDSNEPCSAPNGPHMTTYTTQTAKVSRHSPGPGCTHMWYTPLGQLECLCDLTVHNQSDELLRLPADSLPVSLKTFDGSRLNVIATATDYAASTSAAVRFGNFLFQLDAERAQQPLQDEQVHPRLVVLHLNQCQLSSPSTLASNNLKQLTLVDSSWQGGWTTAAAAWPALQQLTWKYATDDFTGCSKPSSDPLQVNEYINHINTTESFNSQSAYALMAKLAWAEQSVGQMLKDICVEFKHLTSLTVVHLPWLSTEALQRVALQHMRKVTSVRFGINHSIYDLLPVVKSYLPAASMPKQSTRGMSTLDRLCIHVGCSTGVTSDSRGPRLVQKWLQQRLPWANVCVTRD